MALIPPFFLDCVVAIGVDDGRGQRQWIGSGFLYGHFVCKLNDSKKKYRIYVITNRHVVEGQSVVYLRFNPREARPAREYAVNLGEAQQAGSFKVHTEGEIDLAVVQVDSSVLERDGIQFSYFMSDHHVAGKESIVNLGFSEGDFGYILGFPMGLVGEERSFVIVREGAIARIRDYLAGASKEILMDCMIFPGNSGGPVVTKPEVVAIEKTKAVGSAYLIGVVAKYLPYQDVAISTQTKRPRLVFEENSGLASVIPIQYTIDLVESMQPGEDAEGSNMNEREEKHVEAG